MKKQTPKEKEEKKFILSILDKIKSGALKVKTSRIDREMVGGGLRLTAYLSEKDKK